MGGVWHRAQFDSKTCSPASAGAGWRVVEAWDLDCDPELPESRAALFSAKRRLRRRHAETMYGFIGFSPTRAEWKSDR